MGHVTHRVGAHVSSNLTNAFIVNQARVRTSTTDNQLGLLAVSDLLHRLIVNFAGFLVATVEHMVVHLAGPVGGATMAQMTSLVQIHGQNLVADVQHRGVNRVVCSGAGVGLHIDVLSAIQFLGTLAGQCLHLVGEFAAGLVTGTGIAFQGLVGEDATVQFQNFQGNRAF